MHHPLRTHCRTRETCKNTTATRTSERNWAVANRLCGNNGTWGPSRPPTRNRCTTPARMPRRRAPGGPLLNTSR
eukprot:2375641-Lingulodinium_polyedra.AAC.1